MARTVELISLRMVVARLTRIESASVMFEISERWRASMKLCCAAVTSR